MSEQAGMAGFNKLCSDIMIHESRLSAPRQDFLGVGREVTLKGKRVSVLAMGFRNTLMVQMAQIDKVAGVDHLNLRNSASTKYHNDRNAITKTGALPDYTTEDPSRKGLTIPQLAESLGVTGIAAETYTGREQELTVEANELDFILRFFRDTRNKSAIHQWPSGLTSADTQGLRMSVVFQDARL